MAEHHRAARTASSEQGTNKWEQKHLFCPKWETQKLKSGSAQNVKAEIWRKCQLYLSFCVGIWVLAASINTANIWKKKKKSWTDYFCLQIFASEILCFYEPFDGKEPPPTNSNPMLFSCVEYRGLILPRLKMNKCGK